MTKYKLKKEIEWTIEWTEFEYPNDLNDDMTASQINCVNLANLIWLDNDYFEQIEEVKSIYDLKKGDKEIWYNIHWSPNNSILFKTFIYHLEMWEAFLTSEETEKEREKRKALATIKKWSYDNDNGYEYVYGGNNSIIEYYNENLNVCAYAETEFYWVQYYSSETAAKRALKELREEYNLLFNL